MMNNEDDIKVPNKDFILADTVSEKQNTYINEISILPEKVALFNKINRDNGVGGSGLCICFPYMVPDNVSEVGGYLMLHCLNDVNSESFKPLETITASVKRK